MKESPEDPRAGHGVHRKSEDRRKGARWDGINNWSGSDRRSGSNRRKPQGAGDAPGLPKTREDLQTLVHDIVDQSIGGGKRPPPGAAGTTRLLRRFWNWTKRPS